MNGPEFIFGDDRSERLVNLIANLREAQRSRRIDGRRGSLLVHEHRKSETEPTEAHLIAQLDRFPRTDLITRKTGDMSGLRDRSTEKWLPDPRPGQIDTIETEGGVRVVRNQYIDAVIADLDGLGKQLDIIGCLRPDPSVHRAISLVAPKADAERVALEHLEHEFRIMRPELFES